MGFTCEIINTYRLHYWRCVSRAHEFHDLAGNHGLIMKHIIKARLACSVHVMAVKVPLCTKCSKLFSTEWTSFLIASSLSPAVKNDGRLLGNVTAEITT